MNAAVDDGYWPREVVINASEACRNLARRTCSPRRRLVVASQLVLVAAMIRGPSEIGPDELINLVSLETPHVHCAQDLP